MAVHYKFMDFFKNKDLVGAANEMSLYDYESDVNFLKTILIATKGVKHLEPIKSQRERILLIFDKKMKELEEMNAENKQKG